MSKPLIMVVDDNQDVANEVAKLIQSSNRGDAVAVYSAEEAFEQLKKNKVFFGLLGNRIMLIILDIKMPEMDGLQFLKKLREEYGERIGVCILSAYEDEDKWNRATSGLVINYLKKPFKNEELLKTIDDFFRGEKGRMLLETFERHVEKRKEWNKREIKL